MSRFDEALIAVGRAIRELREEQDISRGTLAKRTAIRSRRLRAIENGRYDPPIQLLYALAGELHIELHDLYRRAEARAPHAYAPRTRSDR